MTRDVKKKNNSYPLDSHASFICLPISFMPFFSSSPLLLLFVLLLSLFFPAFVGSHQSIFRATDWTELEDFEFFLLQLLSCLLFSPSSPSSRIVYGRNWRGRRTHTFRFPASSLSFTRVTSSLLFLCFVKLILVPGSVSLSFSRFHQCYCSSDCEDSIPFTSLLVTRLLLHVFSERHSETQHRTLIRTRSCFSRVSLFLSLFPLLRQELPACVSLPVFRSRDVCTAVFIDWRFLWHYYDYTVLSTPLSFCLLRKDRRAGKEEKKKE